VPAPHPVCAPGDAFDGYYCLPAAYGQGAAPPGYRDPGEERALALRMQHRMRGKFTIDLQGGLGLMAPKQWTNSRSVPALSGALLFGYRRNYQPQFGVLVRGGALLGIPIFTYDDPSASSSSSTDSDATFMAGVLVEAAPYFGPFGRFYVGPSVFAGYVGFADNSLQAGPAGTTFYLSDGALYGIGLAGGVVVGEREQTDITFSFRVDLNPDHKMTIFLMGGVGFHR